MTSQDFLEWMSEAGCKNAADIVRTLGVGRNISQGWFTDAKNGKDVTVKRGVALAMSATAAKLTPWPNKELPQ